MSKKKKVVGATVRATTRGLPAGGILNCTDNSGARLLKIITVKGLHTRLTRYPSATVGDMVICSVTKGTPKLRRQIVPAIIVRQKKTYRRADGSWIHFPDNSAVVCSPEGDPRGTEIRGPVAKEAAERWPRVASKASIIL